MTMGKTDLDRCVDQLHAARKQVAIETGFDCKENAQHLLISAVAHLAAYCRQRVAAQLDLTPHRLSSAIDNLIERIEALESAAETLPSWASENPDSPLYGTYARPEPDRRAAPPGPWDCLLVQIRVDCQMHGWDDTDALIAWNVGRDALLRARSLGARFPHD